MTMLQKKQNKKQEKPGETQINNPAKLIIF